MAGAAAKLSGQVPGVYFTCNPVKPALLARAANHIIERAELTTSDHDIERRRWLPIDLDPARPSGICATEEEHGRAVQRAWETYTWLKSQGWPDPVIMDSGNGVYVLPRIDLPNDDASRELGRRCLAGLAFLFNDDQVHVDQTMFNAARIIRIPGTLNAKGDNTADRPHRPVRPLHLPAAVEPVSLDLLRHLATMAPQDEEPDGRQERHAYWADAFDVERFVRDHLDVQREGAWNGGYRWVLKTCPFHGDHTDRSAWVVRLSSGAIAAGCQHNSCTWEWTELREKFDPGYRDRREQWQEKQAPSRSKAEPVEPGEPVERQWPEPMASDAFVGLAGDVVRAIEPHSEADRHALLMQFLVAFGNVVGRSPHFFVEGRRHGANLFVVLVGETAKSRKGSSWSRIRRVFELALVGGGMSRIVQGLSSGEGLIWNVRDPIGHFDKRGEWVTTDSGISDKRLLVVEEEFTSPLRVVTREGNTLAPQLRNAWDGDRLQSLTKQSPAVCEAPHISVVGHIVEEEARQHLTRSDVAGGTGNRFIWGCTRRSKTLPFGGGEPDLTDLTPRIQRAYDLAKEAGRLYLHAETERRWAKVYPELSEGKPGLLGYLTARGEAQAMRLAAIYALLDCSEVIRPEHLVAALAVWEYSAASAAYIFGDALGDPDADEVLRALRQAGDAGMDRTDLHNYSGRHMLAGRMSQALATLSAKGLIRREVRKTSGRPAEHYYAEGR